jgi:hypothetical protein
MVKFFCSKESIRMSRNWWFFSLRILLVVLVVVSASHPAHAFSLWPWWPFQSQQPKYGPVAAPEFDLRLAVEGIAVAGAAGALIWERIRRRR